MTFSPPLPARLGRGAVIGLLVPIASLLAVWFISPFAFFTFLIDLVSTSVVVAPAVLGGRALLQLFGMTTLPRRWMFVFSAALGLGTFSNLLLLFGLMGWLHRGLWIALLGTSAVVGLISVRGRGTATEPSQTAPWPWHCLWIVAAPFLILAILGATHAPGLIWSEEGFGYDVLEYHLQLPKEYSSSGRISYLPHNVYCSFPGNVEMLYLLAMIVHGHPMETGTIANTIHLTFAVLCVLTAWAIGRDISPRAGIVGGVLLATCSWLEYLSGLAYVENGMLFYGMAATGVLLRSQGVFHTSGVSGLGGPASAVLGGITAGFAAGCKYTAIPMIVLPAAVLCIPSVGAPSTKVKTAFVFVLSAFLGVAPWLGKNIIFTGNPVFPLGNTLFQACPPGWSTEQTAQWDKGHTSGATVTQRGAALWHKIIADRQQRLGPAVLGVGLFGLLYRRRDRSDWVLVFFLVIQLAVWLFATHLYARFAVAFLIPLSILSARAIANCHRARTFAIVAAVILGGAWDLVFAVRRHGRESALGVPAAALYEGQVHGFEYLGMANQELPANARILLLGDARPFYFDRQVDYTVAFNHNTFFDLIQSESPEVVMQWLMSRKYTHILVHWSEVRRLESTYGFSPPMTESQLNSALTQLLDRGMRLVKSFPHPTQADMKYVDVFELSRGPGIIP